MEAENKLLLAFQQLLNIQPELIKDSERTELEALIISLPNDTKQLADAIARWCNSHSQINHALMEIMASEGSRGIAGTFSTPEIQLEDEKNLRSTLINALRQSSPPEKPKPPTPKS
ncbi:MAG: hypothetical protein QNJ54_01460 [Prochloraceae cyanobacterium]|nr:hypothetical protein [Prochloraceae cyanobacterium]